MSKYVLILVVFFLPCVNVFAQIDDNNENMHHALLAKSDSLFALGVDLYNAGKYEEAIPVFTESDKIDKAVLDSTSNRRDYSAMWLASCYYHLGNTATAQTIADYYNLEPVDRRLTVESDSLNTKALMAWNEGDLPSALQYAIRGAEIEKTVVGEKHIFFGNTAEMITLFFYAMGDYTAATEYGQLARNVKGIAFCENLANVANSWHEQASLLNNHGLFAEALQIEERVASIRGYVFGTEHPNYAMSLTDMAQINASLGNYDKALRLCTEAMNIQEGTLGKEHPDYALSLNLLALCNGYQGNYVEAVMLCTKAMKIQERTLGKEHPDYALSLHNLSGYEAWLGNYVDAVALCTEALNIRKDVFGTEHALYALSLGKLAQYNAYLGNYPEAIKLVTEAMHIQEKTYGKEHPLYYTYLNDLAGYNAFLGNYSEAVRLDAEALNICEKVYGREHPEYATSLINNAVDICSLGDYTEAVKLCTDARNIMERIYGSEHPEYARSLNNLASYYANLGNYTEAIRLGTEAMNIREKVYGKEHPDYANSLNNLAVYYAELGNYTEAIRLGIDAMRIQEDVLGTSHPEYAISLGNLAYRYYKTRNSPMLDHYAAAYLSSATKIIRSAFSSLNTQSRAIYWKKYQHDFEYIIHLYALHLPTDTSATNGYNALLLSKGLLLNSEIEFTKLIQESGDEEVLVLFKDLQALRNRIRKLQEQLQPTDALSCEADKVEQQLVEQSKVYGDFTENIVITWEQIQEKLTDKDIAVEFVSFPLNADSTMYIAYTLRKGWEYPKMIPLFEEKQLKNIYPDEYYNTTAVSRLVWEPFKEVLEGVETVYFAPSGELYNIAIESVPDYSNDDMSIVSDSRNYYRLSSTRELALIKDEDKWNTAAVYGGLKYGMTAESLTADSRSFGSAVGSDIALTNELYNIADTLSMMRGGELAKLLPGTLIEAEAIDNSLEALGVSSTLYTDSIGTEASFKNLSGKKTSIMHIGTHGFYWTEKEARNLDYKFLMNDETSSRYVEDKQLTRSGLLFAGANYALSGKENQLPEGVDDGILTAKELTTIDLRGLDLVVLSACQTGLGEITGDGVFGLQRGFKKAGAQTIVMSLWKVNDEATRLFMTKFFETMKLDKEGHPTNKHEAFLAAQHYLRDEYEIEQTRTINSNLTASQIRRLEREGKSVEAQTITERVKPYAAPEYWTAFIMLDGVD